MILQLANLVMAYGDSICLSIKLTYSKFSSDKKISFLRRIESNRRYEVVEEVMDMILRAEHIQQPYSGEYIEKIYDIKSPWNSGCWTWIKFTEEDDVWCGEFRGEYRGVSHSVKLGIVVVLTSDYMYVLDISTGEISEYYSQPEYVDITTSPLGDVLVTDGYSIEMFINNKIEDMESIVLPIHSDDLRFIEWRENILEMSCCEFGVWENEVELYLDIESREVW